GFKRRDGKERVHYRVHIGADNVNRTLQQAVFFERLLDVVCPDFAMNVMPQTLSKDRTKSNYAFVVVNHFFYSQLSEPVNDVKESVRIFRNGKRIIDIKHLYKGSSQHV